MVTIILCLLAGIGLGIWVAKGEKNFLDSAILFGVVFGAIGFFAGFPVALFVGQSLPTEPSAIEEKLSSNRVIRDIEYKTYFFDENGKGNVVGPETKVTVSSSESVLVAKVVKTTWVVQKPWNYFGIITDPKVDYEFVLPFGSFEDLTQKK